MYKNDNEIDRSSDRRLDDPARLAALRRTGLLDSEVEEAFDRLTRIASQALQAPVALISLVSADRQFFKSSIGLAEPWASRRETSLSHSFCELVVRGGEPLVVEDAPSHPLVCNKLAIEDLGVVAYLGVPLQLPDGSIIGTLCVIDDRPRVWTDRELELLRMLADLVMSEVERRHERIAAGRARRTEDALRNAQAELRSLLREAPVGIFSLGADGTVLSWNPAIEQLSGYTPDDIVGRPLPLADQAQRDVFATLLATVGAGQRAEGDLMWQTKRGASIPIRLYLAPRQERTGSIRGVLAIAVAAVPSSASLVRSASEIDLVTRLTGGMAHGFNNLLAGILGYTDLLLARLPPGDPHRTDVEEIRGEAARGAKLVSQLLAFSGQQWGQPEELDLNALLHRLDHPLAAVLGPSIERVAMLDKAVGRVRADGAQVEETVLTLALYAREAMPINGRFIMQTTNLTVSTWLQGPGEIAPGDYVLLTLSDTGPGLGPAAQAHIFEPFSVATGRHQMSTGLALAAVRGRVQRAGGHVSMSSDPERGTTFSIYLPRVGSSGGAPHDAAQRDRRPSDVMV